MAPDPTMHLLDSFNDPALWKTVERVAVFRAHERRNEKDEVVYTVTDADLDEIARNTNENLAAAGQPVRLTLGHTDQDAKTPETKQPPVYGFAVGYKVERVRRPDGDYLAITQVEKVKPEYAASLADYPYRSVEYKHDTKTIHGCAALVRTPYLKLGAVVPYRAAGAGTSPLYHYSLGVPAVANENDDDKKKKDEEDYASFAKYMKRYQTECEDEKKKETANAADADKDDDKKKETPNAAVSKEVAYAALEAKIAEVRREQAATNAALVSERTARMLDPLKELVSFDEGRELAYMAAMPSDAARAGHVEYMLKHYEKKPSGSLIPTHVPTRIARGGAVNDAPLSKDEMYAAVDLADRKKISKDEAVAEVLKRRSATN